MRVYSQSSGGRNSRAWIQSGDCSGHATDSTVPGAAVQAFRRKGSIFQTPRGEAGLERRRGPPRWPHGQGVSLSLSALLSPHHPVAEPTGKSEGSPRTVLQADSRGERDRGCRGAARHQLMCAGAAATEIFMLLGGFPGDLRVPPWVHTPRNREAGTQRLTAALPQ